jgi:hypothetical protein
MSAGDEPVREELAKPAENATPAGTTPEKEPAMEIHLPQAAIRNKKDFLIHMLMIVTGILIALGLEALITIAHDRALAHEARVNLAIEIHNNRQTIDRALGELQGRKKGLEEIIHAMQALEAGKPGPKELNYIFVGYDLYSTAWTTAAASGATAQMGYAELKRYTDLYNLQQIFMNVQYDAFRATTDISDLNWVIGRDPKTVSKSRFEQIETAAARYMTILDMLAGLAQQLRKQYAAFEQH